VNAYIARGIRTDIAGQPEVWATGKTPRDAKNRLMQQCQYVTNMRTSLIPREQRYAYHRAER